MSYREARDFLSKYTNLVELTDASGARVAVTPGWQGRVMTSTCGGDDGLSFGFVNRPYIEAGKTDKRFNNLGAEERMWLCPEGGPFSLWFKPGVKQVLENWHTPPALNEGAWRVTSPPSETRVSMATQMSIQNTAGAKFELDVTRDVKLLSADGFRDIFGAKATELAYRAGVKTVAYESANRITNRGTAFEKGKGLVSIWILGMMNSSPQTMVIAPYKTGPESDLGSVVKSDYFGAVPAERLIVTPEAVLFRADGGYRSKIGISQQRAKNLLGSMDFQNNVLTLVQFAMPDEPTKHDYLNNMWGLPQAKPYTGDVSNAYNDGPNDLGQQMGSFYEIESVSPAPVLQPGQSLVHKHRTVHVQADPATLRALAQAVLGVDLDDVRKQLR